MNLFDAAYKFGVSKDTVWDWCKKQYIRGVETDPVTGEYIIPESAKKPYTKHGNPKGDGIYTSIVKGILQDMDVCAELYGMDQGEFDKYIGELKAAGVIDTYVASSTGIEYFCKTMKSADFSKFTKNKVRKVLSQFIPSTVNINAGVNVSLENCII